MYFYLPKIERERETSEGKFSVIALVIARITLNVRTGGNSIVEVF